MTTQTPYTFFSVIGSVELSVLQRSTFFFMFAVLGVYAAYLLSYWTRGQASTEAGERDVGGSASGGGGSTGNGADGKSSMFSWLTGDSSSSVGRATHVLSRCAILVAVLVYSWLNEYHPMYAHTIKEFSWDRWWFFMGLLALLSVATISKSREPGRILNRDQTEEWKGWMQFAFVLYHYLNATDVYNAIRVFVSAYVFMTGFGNFSFFWVKGDYSLNRFARMMWRLNFYVCLIMGVLGTPYILYYIVPLHTFYFLVVFAVMGVFRKQNRTRMAPRVKILVLAVLIFLVWEFDDSIFNGVWYVFKPILGSDADYSLKEWHFRTFLDHYSTMFGMIFALNFPYYTAWLERVEQLPAARQWAIKGAVGALLLALCAWWHTNIYALPKYAYNSVHAYYTWIPIFAFIYFRNVSHTLRSYHSGALHWIGKITLETYLSQLAMLLISNNNFAPVLQNNASPGAIYWHPATLHTLVPGRPLLNMLVVGAVYVFCSYWVFTSTLTLRDAFVPESLSNGALLRRCGLLAGAVALTMLLSVVVPVQGEQAFVACLAMTALAFVGTRLLMPRMSAIFA